MGPGALPSHDWANLYGEYLRLKEDRGPRYDLIQFAKDRDLNYTNTSRNFALRARLIAGNKLAMLTPKAVEKLEQLVDSKEERIAGKASTAILDRAGFAPQAVTLSVNQTNVTAIQIPPLFKEDYSSEYNEFSQEVIDVD